MSIHAYVGGEGPSLDLNFTQNTYGVGKNVSYKTLIWREVSEVWVYRSGAWVQATGGVWIGYGGSYEPVRYGINYGELVYGILRAYSNPSSADGILFNRLVDGRPVGDFDNNSTITLNDVLVSLRYTTNPSSLTTAEYNYLHNTLPVIFETYAPDYDAYRYTT